LTAEGAGIYPPRHSQRDGGAGCFAVRSAGIRPAQRNAERGFPQRLFSRGSACGGPTDHTRGRRDAASAFDARLVYTTLARGGHSISPWRNDAATAARPRRNVIPGPAGRSERAGFRSARMQRARYRTAIVGLADGPTRARPRSALAAALWIDGTAARIVDDQRLVSGRADTAEVHVRQSQFTRSNE
jgi:hypothetical protein